MEIKVRKYPKSSTWRDHQMPDKFQLRIPARVAKVCRIKPGIKVEWRFYKNGVNGFRATIQEVK